MDIEAVKAWVKNYREEGTSYPSEDQFTNGKAFGRDDAMEDAIPHIEALVAEVERLRAEIKERCEEALDRSIERDLAD
jgi:hypothetical protein